MVKINDNYCFSPHFRYEDIDWRDSARVLDAFYDRMMGFYLEPARSVANMSNGSGFFASTLLCAAAVEAMARYTGTKKNGGKRIAAWLERWVPSFKDPSPGGRDSLGDLFDGYFRNGLAHNALVKSLGQVTTEIEPPVRVQDAKVLVNPVSLVEAIITGLQNQVAQLCSQSSERERFRQRIVECFHSEIESLCLS